MNITEIEIKQFCTIVIASKRNSGKSKLVLNILKYMFEKYDFHNIFIFSKTAEFNEDWKWVDKKYINSEIDDNIIYNIINYQKKNIIKNKKSNIIIVLDDVKLTSMSKALSDLFCVSRHYLITVILSVQYPKLLVSPLIRGNVDYYFWSQLNNNTLHAIYESIATKALFNNFTQFENYCEKNNDNYKFIMYDNLNHNKKDRIKIIKSKLYKNYKLNKIINTK